jgi:hypothetical protein
MALVKKLVEIIGLNRLQVSYQRLALAQNEYYWNDYMILRHFPGLNF